MRAGVGPGGEARVSGREGVPPRSGCYPPDILCTRPLAASLGDGRALLHAPVSHRVLVQVCVGAPRQRVERHQVIKRVDLVPAGTKGGAGTRESFEGRSTPLHGSGSSSDSGSADPRASPPHSSEASHLSQRCCRRSAHCTLRFLSYSATDGQARCSAAAAERMAWGRGQAVVLLVSNASTHMHAINSAAT